MSLAGMTTLATFDVIGLPAPQGSKRAISIGGRAQLVDGSSDVGKAKTKDWRAAVANVAREHADDTPHDGPLHVTITFRFPMPASRPKRQRSFGQWPHTVKPDKDKCVRATLDALKTGGLLKDDARVFGFDVEAWEVDGWTGATITLRRWEG